MIGSIVKCAMAHTGYESIVANASPVGLVIQRATRVVCIPPYTGPDNTWCIHTIEERI